MHKPYRVALGSKKAKIAGYTMIETLVFLTVSVALFGSTAAVLNGKQERTRFTQSVTLLQQKLQDTLNDVSTGYYPSLENFTCTHGPTIDTSISADQGTNAECVFLGKAIKLGPQSAYSVYTIIGNANVSAAPDAADVRNLADANPFLFGASDGAGGTSPGLAEAESLPDGIVIKKVIRDSDDAPIEGLSIISKFSQIGSGGIVSGNAAKVDLFAVSDIAGFNSDADTSSYSNDRILICIEERGNLLGRNKGSIKIGYSGELSVENTLSDWPTECN